MSALNVADARSHIGSALDELWKGDADERAIIGGLRAAYSDLGAEWSPPDGSDQADGGFVPSDNNDPARLTAFINKRLTTLRYYDGESAFDGPFLLTPFRGWYDDVIYSPCGSEAQAAHANMLLQWQRQQGIVVSDLLPPYPGRSIGWRWENVQLGSQWIVKVWLTNGAVAVQSQ